jgi:hypothetical protein
VEGLTRLAKDPVPEIGRNAAGDAELGGDAAGGFGVLGAAEAAVDGLHMVNGEVDHMLEALGSSSSGYSR